MGGSARTASNVLVNLGARKVQIRPYTAQGGFNMMDLVRFLGIYNFEIMDHSSYK